MTRQMSLMMETSLHMTGSLGKKRRFIPCRMSHSINKLRCRLALAFIFHRSFSNHIHPVKVFAWDIWTFHHPHSLCFRGFSTAQCETTLKPGLGRRKPLFQGTLFLCILLLTEQRHTGLTGGFNHISNG